MFKDLSIESVACTVHIVSCNDAMYQSLEATPAHNSQMITNLWSITCSSENTVNTCYVLYIHQVKCVLQYDEMCGQLL